MRITKVVTKRGDKGNTTLGDGTKVSKSDLRIRCIGEVDELNSFIGFVKCIVHDGGFKQELNSIQNDLFNLGGELSYSENPPQLLKNASLLKLENSIEQMNEHLSPLKEFILPGNDELSTRLHIARTVCRRVERIIVERINTYGGQELWVNYLNRLSDYLFVWARFILAKKGYKEIQWNKY